MSREVKFIRNGSPDWIGIKFPKRKGTVWISQSDFDILVDTIICGLNIQFDDDAATRSDTPTPEKESK